MTLTPDQKAEKDKQPKPDFGVLEEDDEFEEFPAEGINLSFSTFCKFSYHECSRPPKMNYKIIVLFIHPRIIDYYHVNSHSKSSSLDSFARGSNTLTKFQEASELYA